MAIYWLVAVKSARNRLLYFPQNYQKPSVWSLRWSLHLTIFTVFVVCRVGPDCFTIFEECGRFWDGKLSGVLDPDQWRSWNYPSGSHVPDLGRVISYGTQVERLNQVISNRVLNGILATVDWVKKAEIHPAMRIYLAALKSPDADATVSVFNQRRNSEPLFECVSLI